MIGSFSVGMEFEFPLNKNGIWWKKYYGEWINAEDAYY